MSLHQVRIPRRSSQNLRLNTAPQQHVHVARRGLRNVLTHKLGVVTVHVMALLVEGLTQAALCTSHALGLLAARAHPRDRLLRCLLLVPLAGRIDIPNNIKGATVAAPWQRQVHPGTHLEVLPVADLNDAACQVVVFVNEVNLLIQALLGPNSKKLGLRQLLEHAWTQIINQRPRPYQMLHVLVVVEFASRGAEGRDERWVKMGG